MVMQFSFLAPCGRARPPFEIWIGEPTLRPRDVMKSFGEWNKPHYSYIPIDLSKSLGAPALLNYTFDNEKSFQANWEEVQRLKANNEKITLLSMIAGGNTSHPNRGGSQFFVWRNLKMCFAWIAMIDLKLEYTPFLIPYIVNCTWITVQLLYS